jgi:hypothetical protein
MNLSFMDFLFHVPFFCSLFCEFEFEFRECKKLNLNQVLISSKYN